MKKAMLLILTLALSMSLYACGGGSKSEENAAAGTNSNEASTEAANDMIVFDEPVVVWEDENIQIEAIGFYQEFYNWGDREPATEKGVTFRYVNKTDHQILIQLDEAYLGMDAVQIMHCEGSETPAPGKATTRNYIFQYVTGPTTQSVDSMEDLYVLDGRFFVGLKKTSENMIDESYYVSFAFEDLLK